ncbi:subunit 17 of mediator complex-domain-containing protein [Whalleya microplaca]|nr:subunit 17 of mediator complex-domain-containing protein [Whalleya microplaca]
MSNIGGSPFSLRPWPINDKKPKNLAEFIARVNAERGGFRNLTEAKLRDEIKAQEDGVDVEGSDGESDSEESDADKSKSVVVAREEILRNIEIAHQSAMLCLDFVSLLLTKESPVQAGTTLSPALRELVGIGTLGASIAANSNITKERAQDDLAIATGWRLMGISNMVDSVVASAEKLEKEIELETRYWADVLAVSETGWAVCHIPQEPQTLGVRFGFSESAPDFRNNSIAPMRRNPDGSVHLDLGRYGRGSQRVRVTMKRDGVIVDQSPLPARTPDDAPLQERVLEARNTAFHQELWYEINKEARTLLSSNVYSDASTITWKQDSRTEFIFTLEDLGERDNAYENVSNIKCSCTAYYVYMQFLLFQGHRQNYYRRSTLSHRVPDRMAMHQNYTILRAVIATAEYFKNCMAIVSFFEDLVRTLRRAGITTASYKAESQPLAPLNTTPSRRNPKTELNLVNSLLVRLEMMFELSITPETTIFARARAMLMPYIGTPVGISLVPFSTTTSSTTTTNPNPNNNNNTINNNNIKQDPSPPNRPPNPLEALYPPYDPQWDRTPYPSAQDAIYYLRGAAVRAAGHKLAADLRRDDIVFTETTHGPGLRDGEWREAWLGLVGGGCGGGGGGESAMVMTLDAHLRERDGEGREVVRERRWMWSADGDAGGEEGENVLDVVCGILGGGDGGSARN